MRSPPFEAIILVSMNLGLVSWVRLYIPAMKRRKSRLGKIKIAIKLLWTHKWHNDPLWLYYSTNQNKNQNFESTKIEIKPQGERKGEGRRLVMRIWGWWERGGGRFSRERGEWEREKEQFEYWNLYKENFSKIVVYHKMYFFKKNIFKKSNTLKKKNYK